MPVIGFIKEGVLFLLDHPIKETDLLHKYFGEGQFFYEGMKVTDLHAMPVKIFGRYESIIHLYHDYRKY